MFSDHRFKIKNSFFKPKLDILVLSETAVPDAMNASTQKMFDSKNSPKNDPEIGTKNDGECKNYWKKMVRFTFCSSITN